MKKQFLLILAASLLLTACGDASSSGQGNYVSDSVMDVNGFANFASVGASAKTADVKASYAEAADAVMETAAEAEGAYYDESGSYDDPDPLSVKENRKLIRNVSLEMETTDFSNTIDEISKRVDEVEGYIESSGISGDSIDSVGRKYANFTIRVPQARLDEFLDAAAETGSITYKSENVDDVTLQYADTESRIRSLRTEQERLWELMEQADSIDTIIALNQRLSEISYDLDSYESRLKTYDNQVDYSTVTLSVREVRVYTEQSKDGVFTRIQKGFTKNVSFLITTCENIIVWFVSHILTIGIFVCILFFIIRLIKRKVKNRKLRRRTLGKPKDDKKLETEMKAQEELDEKE